MIHQQCPHCGYKVALNEQRYKVGTTVIRQCPQCGNDVEFIIDDRAAATWKADLRRQEQELAALLAKQKKDANTDSSTTTPSIRETPKGPEKPTVTKIEHSTTKRNPWWIIAGVLVCLAVGIVVGVFLTPNQQGLGQPEKENIVAATQDSTTVDDETMVRADADEVPEPRLTQSTDSKYQSFTVGTASFRMVRVEGGTFTMGATAEQGDDADDDEYPTHRVTLSSYWIGETEVTQLLWKEVMGDNPSYFVGNNRPVETVSYNDIQKFIQRLNQRTGHRFRLPTEAEWEYAARGGRRSRGYKYSGSNNIGAVAWYTDNSNGSTHVVQQKQANELGLYDMSGNVWEWCSDWYGAYSSAAQTDPRGAARGSYRVLRGGSWYFNARRCRSSYRIGSSPGNRNDDCGFRLALSE